MNEVPELAGRKHRQQATVVLTVTAPTPKLGVEGSPGDLGVNEFRRRAAHLSQSWCVSWQAWAVGAWLPWRNGCSRGVSGESSAVTLSQFDVANTRPIIKYFATAG